MNILSPTIIKEKHLSSIHCRTRLLTAFLLIINLINPAFSSPILADGLAPKLVSPQAPAISREISENTSSVSGVTSPLSFVPRSSTLDFLSAPPAILSMPSASPEDIPQTLRAPEPNDLEDNPDFMAGEDRTPPVFLARGTWNLKTTSVVILWTTDEPSDSTVELLNGTDWTIIRKNSQLVTSHSILLSGLTPGTIYQVRVKSKDVSGNEGISSPFSFKTLTPAGADISAPLFLARGTWNIKETSAVILWTTDEVSDSRVEIFDGSDWIVKAQNAALVKSHSIRITELTPGMLYSVRVKSKDASGNEGTSNSFTFRTLGGDTTAPVILETSALQQGSSGVLIQWLTNELSDSAVDFYNGASWLLMANSGVLTTEHSLTVTDLVPGTAYQLRVRSKDAAGNEAVSHLIDFTLPAVNDMTPGQIMTSTTILSASIDWQITGDENLNAVSTVRYREQGSGIWKAALGLFRINFNANKFSGSLTGLQAGKTYEVEVRISDPDGGGETRMLTVQTRPEPELPRNGRTLHANASGAQGDGSAENPFGSVNAAKNAAQPGDIVLLHAGTYEKSYFDKAGTPGNYIAFKAAGDGPVLFPYGLEVSASHVWLEGVTVFGQNTNKEAIIVRADYAEADVVIKGNRTEQCRYCIRVKGVGTPPCRNYTVIDNEVRGDTPTTTDTDVGEGIEFENLGTGHVIAYNRVSNVADGISQPGANSDVYGNDIFETSDDGIEMDEAGSNLRIWGNRIQNVRKNSLSFQPQAGAPWYIYRNQIIGWNEGPLKFRTTDRFVFVHNTVVGWDGTSGADFSGFYQYMRAYSRNNLWVANTGGEMYDFSPRGEPTGLTDWRTDIDYNGFDWGTSSKVFTYNGVTYSSIESFSQATGIDVHGVRVSKNDFETLSYNAPWPAPILPQHLTLRSTSAAIDAGFFVPGISHDFTDQAPDLGAYEFGAPLPQYGPRI